MSLTTDPKDPCLISGAKDEGQNSCYLILSDEERAKGFVRPLRTSYIHIGKEIENVLDGVICSLKEGVRGLSEWGQNYYTEENGFAAFLKYKPESQRGFGRFIKKEELEAIQDKQKNFSGCNTVTTMSLKIAETYARNPKFYGATFCCSCNKHIDVNEFIWDDGSNQRVGS